MKKLFFLFALLLTLSQPVLAQDTPTPEPEKPSIEAPSTIAPETTATETIVEQAPEPSSLLVRIWAWFQINGAALIAAITSFFVAIEVIVSLTPTTKDDAWFKWLKNAFQTLFPNRKKGGGVHPKA